MKCYLDTSALVKRYVPEPGSDYIDNVFTNAFIGSDTILLSYWNVGEAATVFDKTERKFKTISAQKSLTLMLDEFEYLSKMKSLELEDASTTLLKAAINLVLRHHIYIADALQIVTAKKFKAEKFLSAEGRLVEVASDEGLEAIYVTCERTATKS